MSFGRLIDPSMARIAREVDRRRVAAAGRAPRSNSARVVSDIEAHRERIYAQRREGNWRIWIEFKKRGYSVAWKYLFDAWPTRPALELDHESFCEALMLTVPAEGTARAGTQLELEVLLKLQRVLSGKTARNKLEQLHVARSNKARTQLLLSRPWWVDRQALRDVYARARAMNKLAGERVVEVRHIVNLGCSNGVCGLHVPWNLRITRITPHLIA